MKERSYVSRLPDGSLDLGKGIIGPSILDQQRSNSIKETKISPRKPSGKSTESRLGQTFLRIIPPGLAAAFVISACGGGNKNTVENTRELEKESSGYALPFPEGETWYLTNGPHGDGWSKGVRYGLDIAPPEVVNCAPGARIALENRTVTASASGEVTLVGDDKNRNDPFHSVVDIKDNKGLTQRYIHLDHTQVKKGDKVKKGKPLGNPSCEFPPGGANTGIHLHQGLMKDGQAIPIDGVVIGGWTIHNGADDKDGTMTKPGEQTRTANVGRYADTNGKIRNDLPNNSNKAVVALPKSPIPPISGKATSKEVFTATPPPTPTAIPTPKPTETPKPVVEKKVFISKKPDELYRALLTNPISFLPQGMSLRGTSAGELDATGKALKQVGAVNILIEDSVLKASGGILYSIFSDSSTAKSASELVGTHLGNGEVLKDFPYSTKTYTIQGIFGTSTTVILMSVDNVMVVTSLTGSKLIGTNVDLMQSKAIFLGHAAIEHLKKVGQ